ncbi:NYN domain-containing protein [Mesorhizobium sp. M2A.F.Ca.ET.043.02.1.1]|uniref:NYN domain-containing protein n=1 Tax=Mesorhizobium sp. M2A.F.Ca.ET.043.02.1.1 TaxID=2493670 RepID=UPI0016757A23|nr:NYN domain-containing protein [Mesorhizobium sp. M2A.F.Ca.ET.043.02.1.1]
MPTELRSLRLALLIDADNVPARMIGRAFTEMEKYGQLAVRRAYGDFSGAQGAAWQETLVRHAIVPHHLAICSRGKNAADIALVIDAMDLLHGGAFGGFCIVSGDSDFAHLATRIREQNLECYVFGGASTPERLKRACNRFIYLENLRFDPLNAADPKMKPLRPLRDALPIVRTAISTLVDDPADWVRIDLLERELERRTTDFDTRTYGHVRLRDLLIALKRPFVVDGPRDSIGRVRMRVARAGRKVRAELSIPNSMPCTGTSSPPAVRD